VSRLKRVSLQNIGPFENLNLELDLSFDAKWHVFLGDNGVGKSTVLRAIALALCGKEAQRYAGRLLREPRPDKDDAGEEAFGTITLETDNKTSYVTTLKRDRRGR
jgi:DNA repair exonuclease SbcCD ATPase subunit